MTVHRLLGALLSLLVPSLMVHASAPVDPLRLTREVVPLAQSVELTLDPARDDFSGRTVIDLVASVPFSRFRLHAKDLVFSALTLTSADGDSTVLTVEVTHVGQGLVTLTAPQSLSPGNYRLTLGFTAKYPPDGLGLKKAVSQGETYLFSQFWDKNARRCFPCWDEPAFKINWQLTLRVPATLAAFSNTTVADERRDGDAKTIIFGRTPPMPSYLVALAVGPFEYVPVPGWTVPSRIITPKGQSALAAEAVKLTAPLMTRLEEYFGIPYPYAKYDQLAVPDLIYGAMENAGLVSFTDQTLLLDAEQASFSQRQALAAVIAHEGAHMWFGNLVTMRWWDDLWLNESFADWMSGLIVDQQFPELRIRFMENQAIKGVMRLDALPSISAIRRPVTVETDMFQLIDELTYFKGKGVLGMVENWIGPAKFRAAMRAYCLQHRWGSTTSEDLWAAFSAVSGEDIAGLLSTFINQPGLPLVSLALEPDGRLRLTQRRFHNLGAPPLDGQWQIPVVLSWSKDHVVHRERILLKEREQVVRLPGLATADWIYPNAAESGYYRWSLSPELNARLLRAGPNLSPLERVGLLDNTSALFTAGLIDGTAYLAGVTALGRDPDPDVSAGVAASLAALDSPFITAATRPTYNRCLATLLRPILDRIGLRPVAGEPATHGPLRATLYGALGQQVADPAVVAECRRLATLFFSDPNQVDAALLTPALAVSAYHGDAALFAALQAAFEKTPSPVARAAILAALGNFGDPARARQALDYSLTPAINSTELYGMVRSVAADPDRLPLAVRWIITHYEAIAAKAPPFYLAYLIDVTAAEPELFNPLRDFLLAPERKTELAGINIQKAAERLALRLRLRAKEQANVVKFLESYPGHPPKN